MRVVITGHTQGIGAALYKSWGSSAVGLSRSNGYDIDKDFDRVVESATGCDLFINNVYRDKQQTKLVHALKGKVGAMVVMGSVSRLYPELIPTDYVQDKQELAEACRLISIQPDSVPILHLDLGFIEGTEIASNDPSAFTSDYVTQQHDIVEIIHNWWLSNRSIRQIEFTWKLTPHVYNELLRINPNLDPSRITF